MAITPEPASDRQPSVADVAALGRGCRPETVAALRRAATIRGFVRDDLVVRQGEDLPIVVVLDGFLAMRRADANGHTFSLVVLRAGQCVGLRATSRPIPAMFELVALSDGRAAVLRGNEVRTIAARDPVLALRLVDLSTAIASLLIERLDEIQFDTARQRLSTVLLAYEPLVAAPAPVLSRTDLASLIGTSREMLGLVMRNFEANGVIRRARRGIRILDRMALRMAADWDGVGREHAEWLQIATGGDTEPGGAQQPADRGAGGDGLERSASVQRR